MATKAHEDAAGKSKRDIATTSPVLRPVSVRLDSGTVAYLQRLAREESLRRNCDVTMADLIRDAVARIYPAARDANVVAEINPATPNDIK